MIKNDIEKEIAQLVEQRQTKLQELFSLDGALQAFKYMLDRLDKPADDAPPVKDAEIVATAEAV